MKMTGKILIMLLAACTAGTGSFFVTRSLEEKENFTQDKTIQNWLDLSEQQNRAVQKSTPDFRTNAGRLSANYQNERRELVLLLKNPNSSDEQILDQIENVIQANGKLFRCVVGYVLSVRPYLSVPQHRRLMNFCGNIINGRIGRQFFRDRNIPPGPPPERGPGFDISPVPDIPDVAILPPGRGLGPGQGMGRGQGQGMRRGQGQGVGRGQERGRGQARGRDMGQLPDIELSDNQNPRGQANRLRIRRRGNFSRRIGFNLEQMEKIYQLDPDFDEQTLQLSRQLKRQHQQLALLLKKPDSSDDAVWGQLENLFRLRNRLDRRIARHVLVIRPYLTPQQQKRLISLSDW
ncbi:hypothetical protein ACFL02_06135 [Planctomycetota bacterium]